MTEASITAMGQCPTREIAVGEKKHIVILNADLTFRFQDIVNTAIAKKISSMEAQRRACEVVYGRTLWQSIPSESLNHFSEIASEIFFSHMGIERPSKAETDEDNAEADAEESGKNVEAPPAE